MASLQQRHWRGEVAGLTSRDRRPCVYKVYLPDRLQGRRYSLDGVVAAEITQAETALVRRCNRERASQLARARPAASAR